MHISSFFPHKRFDIINYPIRSSALIFVDLKSFRLSFLILCFSQDHQYIRDDLPHRDHHSDLRPSSSDRAQAHNYKNRERFATIKSASLVRKRMISSLLHPPCHPLTPLTSLSFILGRKTLSGHLSSLFLSLSPSGLLLLFFLFNCLFILGSKKNWPHFLIHSHVCCQGNVIQSIASCSRCTSHWCFCCSLLLFDNVGPTQRDIPQALRCPKYNICLYRMT